MGCHDGSEARPAADRTLAILVTLRLTGIYYYYSKYVSSAHKYVVALCK